MVIHSLIKHNAADNSISISLKAAKEKASLDMQKKSKHIRVTESTGTYLIKEIGEGKVRITWQQHTDPAGKMPQWLVNTLLTELPFNTLKGLRGRVVLPKYRDAKLKYNDSGKIVAWLAKPWEPSK